MRGSTRAGAQFSGEERILDWEGALNARDTGGLPTADGRQIRRGALVRSDVLTRLTPSGRRALIDHGVRTIVDVRTSEEVGRDVEYPFRETRAQGEPEYVNVPFVRPLAADQESEVRARREAAQSLADLNRVDLDVHRVGIGAVVAAFADAQPGGVLIHCHAGKDRTGLSVGLLLAVAEVSDEDIADDYALTMLNLEPLIMEWLYTYEDEGERARMRDLATPRREAMLAALSHVRERYGDVGSYLRAAGVDDQQLERIRERLVAEAPEGLPDG